MNGRHEEERLPIADEVELMQAIMQVGEKAMRIGFDAIDRAKVMTAASELGRNILKYAGTGVLITARIQEVGRSGIEIVAEDHGPGISDTKRALEDHFSTSGTLGLGLPGVRRLMDEFEIASTPGQNTRVTILKWLR
jgi:serine/threonine-protein kinase RsbT